MELRQLKYFQAVAEELHFGRAARRLNISQPPLSMQIRALEDELGFELFHRTKRKVELSDAGRQFLTGVRQVLAQAELAVERASQAARGLAGVLTVGFMGPAMGGPLPASLRRFAERYPDIELTLVEMGSVEQIAALRTGTIDLAVVRSFGHTPADLEAVPLWRDEYVLAVEAGHRLAGAGRVTPVDLADEPLILFPRQIQPELHDAIIAAFQSQGITPRIAQRTRTKQNALALAAAGLGLAIVPRATARTRPDSVEIVELAAGLPPVEISLAWLKGSRSTALCNLTDTLLAGG